MGHTPWCYTEGYKPVTSNVSLKQPAAPNDIFLPCLQEMSPHERAIRRDLNRTFPEHSFFKERDGVGQESLFNVLKAYSVHDKEVGYCQGSPFMVGLLLMQVRGVGQGEGPRRWGIARAAPSWWGCC